MLEPFVLFPRRAKLVEEAVERALEQIQMTQRRKNPVGLLSAGLQQRVSLGVALLWDPEVLLLDEPLAMADETWSRQALQLFRDHAQRGRSVLYATANTSLALEADQLVLIRAGRLLRSGRTDELVPAGAAKVSLKYALKTGPLAEEVEVQDLEAELPQLMERKPGVRPIAVEIRQDARGARLAALLDN
jgi:ABC-type multidrug transport system ATPase subunit